MAFNIFRQVWLDDFNRAPAHVVPAGFVFSKLKDGIGQGLGITRRYQNAVLILAHDLRDAADRGRDYSHPVCHCFQDRDRKAFCIGRQNVNVSHGHQRGFSLACHPAIVANNAAEAIFSDDIHQSVFLTLATDVKEKFPAKLFFVRSYCGEKVEYSFRLINVSQEYAYGAFCLFCQFHGLFHYVWQHCNLLRAESPFEIFLPGRRKSGDDIGSPYYSANCFLVDFGELFESSSMDVQYDFLPECLPCANE